MSYCVHYFFSLTVKVIIKESGLCLHKYKVDCLHIFGKYNVHLKNYILFSFLHGGSVPGIDQQRKIWVVSTVAI